MIAKLLKLIDNSSKRFLRTRINAAIAVTVALALVWISASFPSGLVQAQNSPAFTTEVPSLRLHHVTLLVNDVDLVSKWYAQNLGFTITNRFTLTRADGSQVDVARVELPGLLMNISKLEGSVPPDRSINYQGWRQVVFQVDDVDKNYQLLRSKGVEFIGEPYTYDPPGFRVAYFRDPEGNILEIYQDIEK